MSSKVNAQRKSKGRKADQFFVDERRQKGLFFRLGERIDEQTVLRRVTSDIVRVTFRYCTFNCVFPIIFKNYKQLA
jgi:hypothetical protein